MCSIWEKVMFCPKVRRMTVELIRRALGSKAKVLSGYLTWPHQVPPLSPAIILRQKWSAKILHQCTHIPDKWMFKKTIWQNGGNHPSPVHTTAGSTVTVKTITRILLKGYFSNLVLKIYKDFKPVRLNRFKINGKVNQLMIFCLFVSQTGQRLKGIRSFMSNKYKLCYIIILYNYKYVKKYKQYNAGVPGQIDFRCSYVYFATIFTGVDHKGSKLTFVCKININKSRKTKKKQIIFKTPCFGLQRAAWKQNHKRRQFPQILQCSRDNKTNNRTGKWGVGACQSNPRANLDNKGAVYQEEF